MHEASPLILAIAMLGVFALAIGGGRLAARRGDRKRGILMLVAAAVLFGNVLLWGWPV